MELKKIIQYEDFGAVGDGVTDDMEAICAAHDYANAHKLPVKSRPDAEYYIGPRALTAIIQTDTDWSTTRFIIDDRGVENNKVPCFLVSSALQAFELPIEKLTRDQKHLDFYPEQACYVKVTNSNEKKYIRLGLNQDKGSDQTDCFILNEDGSITSPIDWDYDQLTEATAWPIDSEVLSVRGGIFTTIANQAESVYNYYNRGIEITRSNTVIDGISHYVIGEGKQGSPYGGFISAKSCANITIQNCFFTGHKIYKTIGRANLPVSMGTYDINANSVVNFTIRNCRMNHINDKTRWGVMASNFCKNILVEDCVLSRLDAHMGVSGTYTVRNSQLGWQGLNAIGRGMLTLENVTLHGRSFLHLRDDYGSTWEGNVKIKDCKWVLRDEDQESSEIFSLYNNGMHDFGYQCYMPNTIEINNLYIDDSAVSDRNHELYLFADPCAGDDEANLPPFEERPYPYILCEKVSCKDLELHSKKTVHISKNKKLFQNLKILGGLYMPNIYLKQMSSLEKVFLRSMPEKNEYIKATALKGEEFSYQIAYNADVKMYATIEVHSDLADYISVKRVGNVPSELPAYIDQHDENYISIEPGLFPDVLYPIENNEIVVHKNNYHSLWITVNIDENIKAGKYPIEIIFKNDELSIRESRVMEIQVIDAVLPEQKLIFTQWFHADCIASYYDVEIFSDKHWAFIGKFIKMAVDHGINMILTPIFTPPLDTAVGGERPTVQLVDVIKEGDHYTFKFDNLRKWVKLCKEKGIKYFEMSHLFTQWGAEFTPKIMATENGVEKRIFGWDVKANSDEYKNFLSQFLPKLVEFLKEEGIAHVTYFHISDEPRKEHLESYKIAKELVYDYIKDFHIIDALSDYDFYETGLLTKVIPANNKIDKFLENNVPNLWTYNCCSQNIDVSNRFMAMPSYRNRIIGAQLYKFDIEGFLHWGYNFYYSQYSKSKINPFLVTDAEGAFPSGDAFSVYPYHDGPIESIRLKVFKEALQDLRAMQLLEKYMPKSEIIRLIEEEAGQAISFSSYPHSAEYILTMREKINKKIEEYINK